MVSSFERKREYNHSIDVLKGILILLVVFEHMLPVGKGSYLIQSFHMPLFLGVFGYLITSSKMDMSYFKRRAKRLAIPFLTVSALYYSIGHLLYYKDLMSFTTVIGFFRIFIVPTTAHTHLWFLYSALIHFILIFILVRYMPLRYVFFSTGIFLVVGILIDHFAPHDPILELRGSFGWFVFSLWGFLLANYSSGYISKWKGKYYLLVIGIYLVLSALRIYIDTPDYSMETPGLFSSALFMVSNLILISIVLTFVTDHDHIRIPIFDFLGKNTMIIYLFHPLFRLFAILVLGVQGYAAVFLLSIFPCIPIILLERRSRVLRFLISGR